MKNWLNLYGLVFLLIILIPNIIFAMTHKEGFDNKYQNQLILILEQIGRFGCFIFMIITIPRFYKGFWFPEAKLVYVCLGSILVFLYCLGWLVFWKENSLRKALILSILPSILFVESGLLTFNIPLVIFSILFSICHILISYQNAIL